MIALRPSMHALVAIAIVSCSSHANAQLKFDAAVVYPAGSAPSAVMAIDLGNDTDLDLVVANRITSDIAVMMNAGDGTYTPSAFYQTHDGPEDSSPRALSKADLNDGGNTDIIVVNELLQTIAIVFNDGTGILATPIEFAVFKRPTDIEAADFDSDGDIDFAISHYGSSTGPLAILNNNGSNANLWLGFAEIESYAVQAGCRAVAAADLDGDEDLAVCNRDSGTVSILLNDSTGTFTLKEHRAVPTKPRDVSIQDLDGDNTPDLAVADFDSGSAHFITNRGGVGPAWLGFSPPFSIAGGGLGPHSITYADFDLDGDNDIAMGNVQSRNIAVFENLGSMQFDAQLLDGGAPSTAQVIAHDINDDCAPDLITSNRALSGSASVHLGISARCPCYADCDQSTGVGILDIFDFLCFQASFVSAHSYACDCDLTTGQGVCDIFDFLCFQSLFVSGCQ